MQVISETGVNNPETAQDIRAKRGIKEAIVFDYHEGGIMRPQESDSFSKQPLQFKANCYADIGDWSIVMVENEIEEVLNENKRVQDLYYTQCELTSKNKERFSAAVQRLKDKQIECNKLKEEINLLKKERKDNG